MSKEEKAWARFCRVPIPNDITFAEIEQLAKKMGCQVSSGGKHTIIVYKPLGAVIPVPRHGKTVGEAYIKQLKDLFYAIKEEKQ